MIQPVRQAPRAFTPGTRTRIKREKGKKVHNGKPFYLQKDGNDGERSPLNIYAPKPQMKNDDGKRELKVVVEIHSEKKGMMVDQRV